MGSEVFQGGSFLRSVPHFWVTLKTHALTHGAARREREGHEERRQKHDKPSEGSLERVFPGAHSSQ